MTKIRKKIKGPTIPTSNRASSASSLRMQRNKFFKSKDSNVPFSTRRKKETSTQQDKDRKCSQNSNLRKNQTKNTTKKVYNDRKAPEQKRIGRSSKPRTRLSQIQSPININNTGIEHSKWLINFDNEFEALLDKDSRV